MHAVIMGKYNFENDDLATVYIAFFKSIVIRLNAETMNFFFNEVIQGLCLEIL